MPDDFGSHGFDWSGVCELCQFRLDALALRHQWSVHGSTCPSIDSAEAGRRNHEAGRTDGGKCSSWV